MNTAIMQPYIFPYLGYFQLIGAVDVFVFYDDVNFIKRGWVNRNKILIQNEAKRLTFPCIKASQNKWIKEVEVDLASKEYQKLYNSIFYAYKNAPYFEQVLPIIDAVFSSNAQNIGELAIKSIEGVADYLNMNTRFMRSSGEFPESQNYSAADRLIDISKKTGATTYINALGGRELYEKSYFAQHEIQLQFLEPHFTEYHQFGKSFVPQLSIIDVLMFNSQEKVLKMLTDYALD